MDKAGKYGIMGINQEGIKKNEGRSIKRVKKSKFIPCKGGKVRRPAVALQKEKRRGGCAYESLAERKTKDAA